LANIGVHRRSSAVIFAADARRYTPITEVHMTILESAQRQAVLSEAESWIGTPFHHQGRAKGRQGGVDCAMLLLEVFLAAGVIKVGTGVSRGAGVSPAIPNYSQQWHLHREEERYLEMIRALGGREISNPLHGDLAVWKIGRAYSHGAIVLLWPCIIHAAAAPVSACILDNALLSALNLGRYPVKFFTAWPEEVQGSKFKVQS
jgi:cell wall-associated NlpC family hydrolase